MKMEFRFSSPWGERRYGAKAISDYAITAKGLDPIEQRQGAPVKHDAVGWLHYLRTKMKSPPSCPA